MRIKICHRGLRGKIEVKMEVVKEEEEEEEDEKKEEEEGRIGRGADQGVEGRIE